MLYRFFAIFTTVLMLSVAGPAQATLTKILWKTGMTQEDIDLMSQTAGTLYRSGAPKVGQSVSWNNPETGAKGTSTLVSFQNNCARLKHVIVTTRRPDTPQEFQVDQCKTSDGSWILAP